MGLGGAVGLVAIHEPVAVVVHAVGAVLPGPRVDARVVVVAVRPAAALVAVAVSVPVAQALAATPLLVAPLPGAGVPVVAVAVAFAGPLHAAELRVADGARRAALGVGQVLAALGGAPIHRAVHPVVTLRVTRARAIGHAPLLRVAALVGPAAVVIRRVGALLGHGIAAVHRALHLIVAVLVRLAGIEVEPGAPAAPDASAEHQPQPQRQHRPRPQRQHRPRPQSRPQPQPQHAPSGTRVTTKV